MHVMRLHIVADRPQLKVWSASDRRRTGGKAVPIKEHYSDTAYPSQVFPFHRLKFFVLSVASFSFRRKCWRLGVGCFVSAPIYLNSSMRKLVQIIAI